jgi:hypothetical protein
MSNRLSKTVARKKALRLSKTAGVESGMSNRLSKTSA